MAEATVVDSAVNALEADLRATFGDAIGARSMMSDTPEFAVQGDQIAEVGAWLKREHGLNHLVLLSSVDRLDHLDLVYLLDAAPEPGELSRIALRVSLDRDDPRVPTVSSIWAVADWHEREAWDLMGVRFEGHPYLHRILLPEYWEGHPLRKDYRYDSNTMVDKILEIELGPDDEAMHDPQARRTEVNGLVVEELSLNMGPQHPSTHGVLRLRLQLDGEYVRTCEPDLGFLHRSFEKLAELKTYVNGIPLTDRWDYLNAMGNNQIHCQVTEKLMGQEVPERAHWIRMLVLELNRLASHLVFVGTYGLDVGAATPFLHCFRDRERLLDMFELLCGARLTYNYIRIGGVSSDLPRNFISDRVRPFLDYFPARLEEVNNLLTGNEVFRQRTIGVGVWTPEQVIDFGVTGPLARASGVKRDVRKAYPYARYDQLEFDIPVGERGDCMDRYTQRVAEMHESVKILHQICDWFASHEDTRGEYQGRLPKSVKPPEGEAYSAIESARGELGIHMISDGSEQPYRCKIRRSSYCNLSILPLVARDLKVADLIAVLGTTDIVMGEVDG